MFIDRATSRSSKPPVMLLVPKAAPRLPLYSELPVPVAAVVSRVFHFFRMVPSCALIM